MLIFTMGGLTQFGQPFAGFSARAAVSNPHFAGRPGQDGLSPDTAFQIHNATDLDAVRQDLGEPGRRPHYRMHADIDLAHIPSWEPIGCPIEPFMGWFDGHHDGQNHSILYINISRPDEDFMGLFGFTRNAIIMRMGLASGTIVGGEISGGIVGYAENTIICTTYNRAMVGTVENLRMPEFMVKFDAGGGTIILDYNSNDSEARYRRDENGVIMEDADGNNVLREESMIEERAEWNTDALPPSFVAEDSSFQSYLTQSPHRIFRRGFSLVGWDVIEGHPGAASLRNYQGVVEDMVLRARWQRNSYRVEFLPSATDDPLAFKDAGGGEWIQNMRFEGAFNEDMLPVPGKRGHTFTGSWRNITAAGQLGAESTLDNIMGHTTFAAEWNRNLYTVTFNPNFLFEGSHVGGGDLTQQILFRESAPELPELTAVGADFLGWDAAGDYTVTSIVEGNMAFTGRWQAKTYVVTFNAPVGSSFVEGGNRVTRSFEHNQEITPPAITLLPGYNFHGWDIDTNYGSVVNNASGEIKVRGPESFTANLSRTRYTVTFNPNSGIWADESAAPQTVQVYSHTAATPPAVNPTRLGFNFISWQGPAGSDIDSIVGNTVFTAEWNAVQFNITYVVQGGAAPGAWTRTYTIEQSVTMPVNGVPAPVGMRFVRWDTPQIPVGRTGHVTITAQYEWLTYSVLFQTGTVAAHLVNGMVNAEQVITHNQRAVAPTVSTAALRFLGWKNSATGAVRTPAEVNATAVTGNTIWIAQWGPNQHRVTFDARGHHRGHVGKAPSSMIFNHLRAPHVNMQPTAVVLVNHGGTAVFPGMVNTTGSIWNGGGMCTITRMGFLFVLWDRGLTNIIGDTVIRAHWGSDPGGIAGVLSGPDAIIRRSFNTGEINGAIAGGIVGTVREGARVEDVYNTGTISGIEAGNNIGGIIGHLEMGSIDRAFSTGRVHMIDMDARRPVADSDLLSTDTMGGLIGLLGDDVNPDTDIGAMFYDRNPNLVSGLYAIGTGGLVGAIVGGPESVTRFGRTRAQMQASATFVGFHIDQIIPDPTVMEMRWTQIEGRLPRLVGVNEEPVRVPVWFDGNGGTLSFWHPEVVWALERTNINEAQVPQYEREGHKFIGFADKVIPVGQFAGQSADYRQKVETGAFLKNITLVRVGDEAEPVELFAVWEVRSLTVTFDLNGGTRTGGGALSQTVAYGGRASMPDAHMPGEEVFLYGWQSTRTDIPGLNALHTPGFVNLIRGENLPNQPDTDLLFRAVWRQNIIITFRLNSGTHTGGGDLSQRVPYGGDAIEPTVVREGYRFDGWNFILEDIRVYNAANEVDEVIVTAQWTWVPASGGGDNHGGNTQTPPGGGDPVNNPGVGGEGEFLGLQWYIWLTMGVIVAGLLTTAAILTNRVARAKKVNAAAGAKIKAAAIDNKKPQNGYLGTNQNGYLGTSQRSPNGYGYYGQTQQQNLQQNNQTQNNGYPQTGYGYNRPAQKDNEYDNW